MTLDNGGGGAQDPTSVWGLIWNVVRKPSVLLSVVGLILVLLLILYELGYEPVPWIMDRVGIKHRDESGQLGAEFAKLVTDGKTAAKQYVMPSVTMIVRLEKVGDGDNAHIEADERMIYMVQYLQGTAKGQRAFNEAYRCTSSKSVDFIPGSDYENIADDSKEDNKSWDLFFDCLAGHSHTIVTGARFVYPSKLKTPRHVYLWPGLGANEDAICYPNSDGDLIRELVIRVESSTLDLRLLNDGQDAGLQRSGSVTQWVQPFASNDRSGSPRFRALTARFQDLHDGSDVAGMRVAW